MRARPKWRRTASRGKTIDRAASLSTDFGWALAAVEGALLVAEAHEGDPTPNTVTAIAGVLRLAVRRLRALLQEVDERIPQ